MVFSILSMLLLASCSSRSPVVKELSEVLSSMYDAEKDYRTSQKQLYEIEKSEQLIFDDAMQLTQIEDAELEVKVAELEESLEKRVLLVDEENRSMEEAASYIPEIEKIIKNNSTKVKSDIHEFLDTIRSRYELHSEFTQEYKDLLDYQNDLYDMLLDEEVEYKDLQDQVKKINEKNKAVQKSINEFNEFTVSMNEDKEMVFDSLKEEK